MMPEQERHTNKFQRQLEEIWRSINQNKRRIQVVEARRGPVVAARVYNSANISIPSGAATALTFNSERFDTQDIHSTTVNTGRLTVPVAGTYLITGHVEWASDVNGTYRQLSVRHQGATYIARQKWAPLGSVLFQSIAVLYHLDKSEYVELVVEHDRGANVNINATSNVSPEFAIAKIGN